MSYFYLLISDFWGVDLSPVDLYLNLEKSSWKNQVQRTGFLVCKYQFRNRFLQATQAVKIKFELEKKSSWF